MHHNSSTRYGVYHLFYNITLRHWDKSLRVHTTLLASMCRAMPFSARALKKNIFFDADIVVEKQIKMWFIVVCTLTDNKYVPLLVSQTIFSYCFCTLTSLKKFLKGKSDAYKQLICIMQRAHFQVRVGLFSCQDKYLFRYL